MFAKRVLPPVSRKCGSGHPDSYPYHPHRAHRGLLPEDQTAGQMLLTAGWCHGQERVYAGKSLPHCTLKTHRMTKVSLVIPHSKWSSSHTTQKYS